MLKEYILWIQSRTGNRIRSLGRIGRDHSQKRKTLLIRVMVCYCCCWVPVKGTRIRTTHTDRQTHKDRARFANALVESCRASEWVHWAELSADGLIGLPAWLSLKRTASFARLFFCGYESVRCRRCHSLWVTDSLQPSRDSTLESALNPSTSRPCKETHAFVHFSIVELIFPVLKLHAQHANT